MVKCTVGVFLSCIPVSLDGCSLFLEWAFLLLRTSCGLDRTRTSKELCLLARHRGRNPMAPPPASMPPTPGASRRWTRWARKAGIATGTATASMIRSIGWMCGGCGPLAVSTSEAMGVRPGSRTTATGAGRTGAAATRPETKGPARRTAGRSLSFGRGKPSAFTYSSVPDPARGSRRA